MNSLCFRVIKREATFTIFEIVSGKKTSLPSRIRSQKKEPQLLLMRVELEVDSLMSDGSVVPSEPFVS